MVKFRTTILIFCLFVVVTISVVFVFKKQKSTNEIELTLEENGIVNTESEPKNTVPFQIITKEEYAKYANPDAKDIQSPSYEKCAQMDNYPTAILCEEGYTLANFSKVTRLNQDCLQVVLADNKKKKLCNEYNEAEPEKLYRFSNYLPDIGYVFFVHLYEGHMMMLVNEKTGEEVIMIGKPILSPDAQYFLSTSFDIESATNPNGFQVWRKTGSFYSLQLEDYLNYQDPKGYFGIINPVWVNNNSFYFIKRSFNQNPASSQLYHDEYAKFIIDDTAYLGEYGDDKNGRHQGYIKSVSSGENKSLKIDYITMKGCEPNEDCPNGYKMVNNNPLIRTFPIANYVVIKMQTFSHITSGIDKGGYKWNEVVTLEKFKGILDGTVMPPDYSEYGNQPYVSWFNKLPYWITIKNGVVTEITEQYVP